MADLLTHVLLAYSLCTCLSWRVDWMTERWVVIGMCGTALPDLIKLSKVVPTHTVETLIGLPFTYVPWGTVGGVVLLAGVITSFFATDRKRAYAMLLFGGSSAVVLDGLRAYADGYADFWLYPFLWVRSPTPSLYVSSDPRILGVALLVAAGVSGIDRYWITRDER